MHRRSLRSPQRCSTALAAVLSIALACGAAAGTHQQHTTADAGSSSAGELLAGATRQLQQAATVEAIAAATAGNRSHLPCRWNADDSVCIPSPNVWLLSIRAAGVLPSSTYRQAMMAALVRDRHCKQHKTAAACVRDQVLRCFWAGNNTAPGEPGAACQASDLREHMLFSSKGQQPDMHTIPHSMTCPGSAARTFFECYALAGELEECVAMKQCMVLTSLGAMKDVCVPRSWAKMTMGQLRVLLGGLESLSPAVYGTCAAACWLQQSAMCRNRTSKGECSRLPWCKWEAQKLDARAMQAAIWGDEGDTDGGVSLMGGGSPESSRLAAAKPLKPPTCRHTTKEVAPSNPVDKLAEQYYRHCPAAKTEQACLKVRAPTARDIPRNLSRLARPAAGAKIDWLRWQPPAAPVVCRLR